MATTLLEQAYIILVLTIIIASPASAYNGYPPASPTPGSPTQPTGAPYNPFFMNPMGGAQPGMTPGYGYPGAPGMTPGMGYYPQPTYTSQQQASEGYTRAWVAREGIDQSECPEIEGFGKGKTGDKAVPRVFFTYDDIEEDTCSKDGNETLFCNGAQALIQVGKYIENTSNLLEVQPSEEGRHEKCYDDTTIKVYKTMEIYLTKDFYGTEIINALQETKYVINGFNTYRIAIVDGDDGGGDLDGDGLSNKEEVTFGTDPANTDTDGDGLCDLEEDVKRSILGANRRLSTRGILNEEDLCPLDKDSDDDGLLDSKESKYDKDSDNDGKINALDCDSDSDNLPDGLERGVQEPIKEDNPTPKHSLFSKVNSTSFKIKGTCIGLKCGNSPAEFKQEGPQPYNDGKNLPCFIKDEDPKSKTDMTNPDTDGDNLSDGMEDYCANPDKPNGRKDPASCSGTNSNKFDTDPLTKDTDRDGEEDGIELNIKSLPPPGWKDEQYCEIESFTGQENPKTDPNDWDSDDDGLPDLDCGWTARMAKDCETGARKVLAGDKISARSNDSDGDGLCDGLEKGLTKDDIMGFVSANFEGYSGECFTPTGKSYEVKGFKDLKNDCGCGKAFREGKASPTSIPVITDPLRADTDGDKLTDKEESTGIQGKECDGFFDLPQENKGMEKGPCPNTYETNPNDCDTDGDGLDDYEEKKGDEKSCPISKDTDSGGLPDYKEVKCNHVYFPIPGLCEDCKGKCGLDPTDSSDDDCVSRGCCVDALCAIKQLITVTVEEAGTLSGLWCGKGSEEYHNAWAGVEGTTRNAADSIDAVPEPDLPEPCKAVRVSDENLFKKEVEPGRYKITPVKYDRGKESILFIVIEKDTPISHMAGIKDSPFYYMPFDLPIVEKATAFGAGYSEGTNRETLLLNDSDPIKEGGKTKIRVEGPPTAENQVNSFYEKIRDGTIMSAGPPPANYDVNYVIDFHPSYAYPIIVAHSNKDEGEQENMQYAYEFHQLKINGQNITSLNQAMNWKPLCSNITGIGRGKDFEGKTLSTRNDQEFSAICTSVECKKTAEKCIRPEPEKTQSTTQITDAAKTAQEMPEGSKISLEDKAQTTTDTSSGIPSSSLYGFYYGTAKTGGGERARDGTIAYETQLYMPQMKFSSTQNITAEFTLWCSDDETKVYTVKGIDTSDKRVRIDSSKEEIQSQNMKSLEDVFQKVRDRQVCVYTAGKGSQTTNIFAWNPALVTEGLDSVREEATKECSIGSMNRGGAGIMGIAAVLGMFAGMAMQMNQQEAEDTNAEGLSQEALNDINAQSRCENQIAGEQISGSSRDSLTYLHEKVKASIARCEDSGAKIEGAGTNDSTLRELLRAKEEIEREYVRTYEDNFDNCLNSTVNGKLRDNVPAMKEGRISEKCKAEYFGENSAYVCFFACETEQAFPEKECTYKCEDFPERLCDLPKTCEKSCLMLGGECVEDKYRSWADIENLSIGRVKEIEKAKIESCLDYKTKAECQSNLYCYYSESLAGQDCKQYGLESECPKATCKWVQEEEACIGRDDGCKPCAQATCSKGNGLTPASCQKISDCPSLRLENMSCSYVQPVVESLQENPLKTVLYGVQGEQARLARQQGICTTPSEAEKLKPKEPEPAAGEEPGTVGPGTSPPSDTTEPPLAKAGLEVKHSIIDEKRPAIELKIEYLERLEAKMLRYKVTRTVLVEGEGLPGEEGIDSGLFKKTEGNYTVEGDKPYLLWIDTRSVPAPKPYAIEYKVEAFTEGSLEAEKTLRIELT